MSEWSLRQLLASLHDDIEYRLSVARKSFQHPGSKGDASEGVWLDLLKTYLPKRYQADKAHVVDSEGQFSEQLDIVVYDRQYSPLIFKFGEQMILPAESVYAVFEAKQSINADQVAYAQKKVLSVRRLHRTSLPIPHAGGRYEPKPLHPLMGGLLTLESDWNPPLGMSLLNALDRGGVEGRLNLGCVAAHGVFKAEERGYEIVEDRKVATAFLFELIARLQDTATVPMIDVRAYARWLSD